MSTFLRRVWTFKPSRTLTEREVFPPSETLHTGTAPEGYKQATGKTLNYQSIGSSGGIRQINAKTVDFGATDAPMSAEELEKDGLVQFPAIIGGVVAVVNLDGIKPGQIKLSGELLADLFSGVIPKWNDKRIADMNPGVALPDAAITVVHRADGSGTTAVFTDYLAKVNANWKSTVGAGAAVKWPAASSSVASVQSFSAI